MIWYILTGIFIGVLLVCGIFYFIGLKQKIKAKKDFTKPNDGEMKVVHKKEYKYSGNAYRDMKKKGK